MEINLDMDQLLFKNTEQLMGYLVDSPNVSSEYENAQLMIKPIMSLSSAMVLILYVYS